MCPIARSDFTSPWRRSALFAGAGQVVDVWASHCLAALAEQVWVEYTASGETLERLGSKGGITALAGALACADGHWMVSVPPDPQGWANFVQLVPDPAFKDDASLADEALRRERKNEILDRISLWSQHRTNKRSSTRRSAATFRRPR